MKRTAIILSALLVITACGGKKTPTNENNNNNEQTASLATDDIFNQEAVADFLKVADKAQQQEAKQEFLSGVDQYRNREQPDSAINTFKRSITIYPFAKTYYEMGNAYMDVNRFDDAITSYKMAEMLEYEPISVVLYNISCAYSRMENGDESMKYLTNAIENGYINLDHIMNDPDLEYTRKEPNFNDRVQTAMAGNTSSEAVLFSLYKSHFAQVSFPYMLKEGVYDELDFEKTISYDYDDFVPGMIDAEFSRDVGDEYFYMAKVADNENYVALVYSQAGMWADDPPVHVYLATYKPDNGKVIAVEKIAGMEYYSDSLREATIEKDMSINVKYYIQEWEKDPDEYGYDGNNRKNLNEVASKTFKIDGNGNIKEATQMMGSLSRK